MSCIALSSRIVRQQGTDRRNVCHRSARWIPDEARLVVSAEGRCPVVRYVRDKKNGTELWDNLQIRRVNSINNFSLGLWSTHAAGVTEMIEIRLCQQQFHNASFSQNPNVKCYYWLNEPGNLELMSDTLQCALLDITNTNRENTTLDRAKQFLFEKQIARKYIAVPR